MRHFQIGKFLPLLLFFVFVACQDEPKKTDNQLSSEPPLPKSASPEEVLRLWHDHFDNNRFEDAKLLSTDQTIAFLQDMELLLSGMDMDSSIIQTQFLELKCVEKEDLATCNGLIKDPELNEIYRDSFFLLKQDGRWLVDIPADIFEEPSDQDLQLFEEF